MTRVPRYALAMLAGMALGLGSPPVDAYLALWLGLVAFAWLLEMPAAAAGTSRWRIAMTGGCAGSRSGSARTSSSSASSRRS